jgi:hypothetical protein
MTKLKLVGRNDRGSYACYSAMARESGAASRHVARDANARTDSGARYVDGQVCIRAPAVGAFATAPWDNGPPCEPSTTY